MIWVKIKNSGVVSEAQISDTKPLGEWSEFPGEYEFDQVHTLYKSGDEWLPRPELIPPTHSSNSITFDGLPPNTVVVVVDVECNDPLVNDTFGGSTSMSFEHEGIYQIDLDPPEPYIPLSLRIEI